MKRFDFTEIRDDLKSLGIGYGDKVLVRADMSSLGRMSGNPRRLLIDALLDLVGEEGAVIGLSFTKSRTIFRRDKEHPYTLEEGSIAGAFSKLMLAYPGAYRSSHPTNSIVAIGNFHRPVKEHHAGKHCFEPITQLIEQNGKMLLIGCIHSSPGFSTTHLAQYNLGYSQKSILKNLLGRYYFDKISSSLKWYYKGDIPGCSMGFDKFYQHYEKEGLLKKGKVGNAESFLITAARAYQTEYQILKTDPCYGLCDRDGCISCRMLVTYKWPEPIRFIRNYWRRGKEL